MRRGAWHQFGDRSQTLAMDQLVHGSGVGVIISPRDLSYSKAKDWASSYAEAGADILVDQQFHNPTASVGKLHTYPIATKRQAVSQLLTASDGVLHEIANDLRTTNSALKTTAVLAPAVVYEAGRPDIVDLNEKLFTVAKVVAEDLGIPCYATVFLGVSNTTADGPTDAALSAATALQADGWYFAFEFDVDGIPSSASHVGRYLRAGLTLAATGLPVLHGYVGPMAPLALACGGTGAAVGHSQNLWQFTPDRWKPAVTGGGGGGAPPRYFSDALWGTLIYEDEWSQLPQNIRGQLHTPTPFSGPVTVNQPFLPWPQWDANKHLVYTICKAVEAFAEETDAELVLDAVHDHLIASVALHQAISAPPHNIVLRASTAAYQQSWMEALQSLKGDQADEFEMLRLLS